MVPLSRVGANVKDITLIANAKTEHANTDQA